MKKLRTSDSVERFVLILDNLSAHCLPSTVEFLRAHGVDILFLPPWTTHFLQPLDVLVFRLFKVALDAEIWKRVATRERLLGVDDVSVIVNEGWKQITPESVRKSFLNAHLHPFDVAGLRTLILSRTVVVDEGEDGVVERGVEDENGVVRRCNLLEYRKSQVNLVGQPQTRRGRKYVRLPHGGVDLLGLLSLAQHQQPLRPAQRAVKRARK